MSSITSKKVDQKTSRKKQAEQENSAKIEEAAVVLEVEAAWWEQYVDRASLKSFLISSVFHGLLLLVLAFIIVQPKGMSEVFSLIVNQPGEGNDESEELTEIDMAQSDDFKDDDIVDPLPVTTAIAKESITQEIEKKILDPIGSEPTLLASIPELKVDTDFGGRNSGSRRKLLAMFGGSIKSEDAVRKGLSWLALRQAHNGSWSFDHRRPNDKHPDHQAGSLKNCRTGATGLAIMAMLGAGETHKKGMYSRRVEIGLRYLINTAVKVPEGYDLRGRNGPRNDKIPVGNYPMYAHAIATIALCEAYAMTNDKRLQEVAQGAINFIVATQEKSRGGWRYVPKQAGDLSVTGWMIMALESGKTAGLRIPSIAFERSDRFLDATQSARGSRYSYVTGGGGGASTTSIGLLCRMYLGWEKENTALQTGVAYLSETGPSPSNMYYNYYATQVMHHAGGKLWPKWNEVMRDSLVDSQLKRGIEKGSWNVTDPHGNTGGRLYQTCLSIMTLEVYYRHLPLYQMKRRK